jgi:uncharacterized membrane protein
MAEHRIGDDDATFGVGLHDWGGSPSRRARLQKAIGGGLLITAIAGFVLSFVAVAFGLAPLALPVFLLLIPVAFLGRWLRARGTTRLRQMRVAAARRERPARAT